MADATELVEMRTKVCVVLGAGASADASSAGGPPTRENWQPPLASELFGRRMVFESGAAAHYPGVQILAAELGEISGVSLESRLLKYARDPRDHIQRYFREVPLYLRDLLLGVTVNYTEHGADPGNHIRLCLNLLREHDVAFLDLNYDDYLERALLKCDPGLTIGGLQDYAKTDRRAMVGKVHGSIHWGVALGRPPEPETVERLVGTYCQYDPLGPCSEVIFAPSKQGTLTWRDQRGGLLYPVLTAPLAGKDHTALVCPKDHLDVLGQFMGNCTRYLVIGTSGLDDDLLGFLRHHARSVECVDYVNLGDGAESCKEQFEKTCHAFKNAYIQTVFDRGFRRYLGSDEFQAFLTS